MGALLLVPIRGLAREAIGVLMLDFDHPAAGTTPLTPERMRLAGAVAAQLTLLLENAILDEQLRRRTLRLEALNEIGLALAAGASSEPAALFARLQPQVADVVQGACFLAILDEGNGEGKGEGKGQGRTGATMTVWGAHDEAPLATHTAVPLGTDALAAAIRGGRRVYLDTTDAFAGAAALPPALADTFAALVPQSAVYLPLRLRGRAFGALAVVSGRSHAFATEQIEFLTTVAAQTAVTLEHGRLYGVLRAKGEVRRKLLDQTLQAQEAERKALVDGVLDGALQELASCSYRLDLCIRLSELGRHDRCRDELGQTRRQLAERIEDLRTMVGSLRPSNLDLLGLQSVLRDELTAFQQQTGIQTTFQGRFKERLASPIETRAYRMAQELLANVRRHSRAKTVSVELRSLGDEILLSVTDDGVGFNAEAILRRDVGMGLHGVREGAEILGGAAHIQSRPGTGTRIEIILPRVLREQGAA
jgi:signal transduction histidine kinase